MTSNALAIAYLLFPLPAWLLLRKIIAPATLWGAFILAGTVLYWVMLGVVELEIERNLYQYDLDGDRSFSTDEMTPKAEVAMEEWSSDTGRNFAPYFAIPVTFVWISANFIVLSIVSKIVTTRRQPRDWRIY